MVREGAVKLEVQRHDLQRERRQTGSRAEDRRHRQTAHAVGGVDHDLEGSGATEIDEAAQEGAVVRQHVADLEGAACLPGSGKPGAPVEQPLREVSYLGQARVLPDRLGGSAAQLDPVVPGRVVAGGEHRTGQVERPARVVEPIRRTEPDDRHVDASRVDAVREGARQVR